MLDRNGKLLAGIAAVALSAVAGVSSASAATCVGSCGSSGADGVVSLSPDSLGYIQYVTTRASSAAGGIIRTGASGAALLTESANNRGSTFTIPVFSAAAGDALSFYYDFVTTDSGNYTDYAWAELQTSTGDHVAWLFTARTNTSGLSINASNSMPVADATLSGGSSSTLGKVVSGTTFSVLGTNSGGCFAATSPANQACGNTGWILSDYTIAAAGDYQISFGVRNWNYSSYNSALAFAYVAMNGSTINTGAVPEPATWAMMIMGMGLAGAALRRRPRVASQTVSFSR